MIPFSLKVGLELGFEIGYFWSLSLDSSSWNRIDSWKMKSRVMLLLPFSWPEDAFPFVFRRNNSCGKTFEYSEHSENEIQGVLLFSFETCLRGRSFRVDRILDVTGTATRMKTGTRWAEAAAYRLLRGTRSSLTTGRPGLRHGSFDELKSPYF